MSLFRDALGAGVFFTTFETVKSQAFYEFVSIYYGSWTQLSAQQQQSITTQNALYGPAEIRPHFMVEPSFLLLAGVAATVSQALVQHPHSKIQELHYGRLAWIDAHDYHKPGERKTKALRLYAEAYRKTFKQCLVMARRSGGLRRYLYNGFLITTDTSGDCPVGERCKLVALPTSKETTFDLSRAS